MNILIDIGHPAHVHVTKSFAHEMEAKGHHVLFTCRQKEFIIQLLKAEGFQYVSFGHKYTTTLKKLWGMMKFDGKMLATSLKFKPDIFVSAGSMYAAQVSAILRKPHICIEDTYNMEQVMLYRPFTDLILTGDYEHPVMSATKEFRMAGYNELAYLYPHRFTPDANVLRELGVSAGEKYVIVRFVAWNASHDLGHKGISLENKMKAVKEFTKYGKVFISSEGELPPELADYKLPTHPSRIHDVLVYASLVFGESSTMAEEAAMLGVPSVYMNNASTFYTQHLEKDYQLMYNLTESEEDQQKAIQIGIDILNQKDSKVWKERRDKMLRDRIDVTAFLCWLVSNYPKSKEILKENPNYQYNFR
jgi:predicted glycosyltransferase